MCLSPEVDLTAGLAISVIAIDALRNNRSNRTLPLALVPTVFALHSFASALVWLGLRGDVPTAIADLASNFYLLIAFVFLPMYIPVTILLIEPLGRRRDLMLLVTGAGIYSGFDFLKNFLAGNTSVMECDRYIDFHVTGAATISGGFYVLATCGSLLLSAQRPLVYWGLINAVAIAALNQWENHGLPSLWCFWAAITSGFVAWFIRWMNKREDLGNKLPWEN